MSRLVMMARTRPCPAHPLRLNFARIRKTPFGGAFKKALCFTTMWLARANLCMYCNRTRKQAHGPNQETHVCRPQPFITSMERRYLQTVSKREYIDCRKDRFCQREPAKTVWMHCDRGLGCGCHRTFQFQKNWYAVRNA